MDPKLENLKNESSRKYKKYLEDELYEGGNELVEKMISHIRPARDRSLKETAEAHIENRHIGKTEDDMVTDALCTGKTQSVFAYGYDNPMSKEDVIDCIQTALWEKLDQIARGWTMSRNFKGNILFEADCTLGYGIDENFNLVKTNKMLLVLRQDDNPLSKTGLCIDTCFPQFDKDSEIIKSKDVLVKEYHISAHEMRKYEERRDFIGNMKKILEGNKEYMDKQRQATRNQGR